MRELSILINNFLSVVDIFSALELLASGQNILIQHSGWQAAVMLDVISKIITKIIVCITVKEEKQLLIIYCTGRSGIADK